MGRPVRKGAPIYDPSVARTPLHLASPDELFHHEVRLKRRRFRVSLFINNEFLLAEVKVANDVDVNLSPCWVWPECSLASLSVRRNTSRTISIGFRRRLGAVCGAAIARARSLIPPSPNDPCPTWISYLEPRRLVV